ncbi:hypothetical protein Nepgr_027734 [Nepenthes gracilis]|uniref:Uncharacterized protein n=1 Tax=Nepenthes gracilis TaxID=150966 RepID=A0AAD3Y3U8_NEPGR|nr:hypothetical protein Nepgr_027734 [Nepenthes gracilis]
MDLLPGDGGSASGLNPLYLAGLADHLFDPADVLNLPGGFLLACRFGDVGMRMLGRPCYCWFSSRFGLPFFAAALLLVF